MRFNMCYWYRDECMSSYMFYMLIFYSSLLHIQLLIIALGKLSISIAFRRSIAKLSNSWRGSWRLWHDLTPSDKKHNKKLKESKKPANQPNSCSGSCSEYGFVYISFPALSYADVLGWWKTQTPLTGCLQPETRITSEITYFGELLLQAFSLGFSWQCGNLVSLRQVSAAVLVWYIDISIAISKCNFALNFNIFWALD